ncbi:MAG: ABC transporter ATP-binding protein [Candidatus Curtissbacteria bacterium GW2011_GWB1_40_28]|nr:MAG: ABC transporter ATP-binding protein [Candidatus Curtissbacteria bacterium GW2011_GWB1_40_28]
MKPIIQAKNVVKIYGEEPSETVALSGVSLEIGKGEFSAIVGPSGCGKSTLMHLLGLLDKPTSGGILIDGQKAENLDEDEQAKLRNQKIGFVFQSFNLLDRTSSLNNVMLPLQYNNQISASERKKIAQERLADVGLPDRMGNYPSQLSGGEQQRVAIARALVCDPLADEPTGNLDSKSGTAIMSLLESLHKKGKTVIIVTHDRLLAKMTNRIISMRDGKIISDKKVKR